VNLSFDLVFAALIIFAFLLPWQECIVFDLIALLMINWQPAPSAVLAIYALFPVAVLALRNFFSWEPRLGIPFAVMVGVILIAIFGMPFRLVGASRFIEDALAMIVFTTPTGWLVDVVKG
jgi:hypothetical protein